MTRTGRTKVIYKGTFVSEQSLYQINEIDQALLGLSDMLNQGK